MSRGPHRVPPSFDCWVPVCARRGRTRAGLLLGAASRQHASSSGFQSSHDRISHLKSPLSNGISALRMTNESFAECLGISARTVATWHSDPDVIPRTEMQQLLDEAYETASATARTRFERMTNASGASDTAGSGPQAQALRVAIAVVVRDQEVLLVCRRDDAASGITWQFPAGVIKPCVRPETATIREPLDETGVLRHSRSPR